MPEGRFVSRSITTSEQLGRVSLAADFLFGRCIPHLDRNGRMVGNPVLVKSGICPLRPEITEESIPDLIRELSSVGLVRWYEVQGKQILEFPGFLRHQKGAKLDREAASRFAAPDAPGARDVISGPPAPDLLRTYSGPTPDQAQTLPGATLAELRTYSGPTPDQVRLSEVKRSEVKDVLLTSGVKETLQQEVAAREQASEPAADSASLIENQASVIIRRANRGMVNNPAIDSRRFRPIETSHGSRSHVVEWLQAGIPAQLISDIVEDRARAYQPSERRKQITTMLYFDSAVREEWDRRAAAIPENSEAGRTLAAGSTAEAPRSRAPRSGKLTRVDGLDPEKAKADEDRRLDQQVAAWAKAHPDDTTEIEAAIAEKVRKDFAGGPVGEGTMQKIAYSEFRKRVLERIDGKPALGLVKEA